MSKMKKATNTKAAKPSARNTAASPSQNFINSLAALETHFVDKTESLKTLKQQSAADKTSAAAKKRHKKLTQKVSAIQVALAIAQKALKQAKKAVAKSAQMDKVIEKLAVELTASEKASKNAKPAKTAKTVKAAKAVKAPKAAKAGKTAKAAKAGKAEKAAKAEKATKKTAKAVKTIKAAKSTKKPKKDAIAPTKRGKKAQAKISDAAQDLSALIPFQSSFDDAMEDLEGAEDLDFIEEDFAVEDEDELTEDLEELADPFAKEESYED